MKPALLVFCVLIALVPNVFSAGKVNVTVYYEALCGDSKRFITTQLAPNYEAFKDYTNVQFVPYGKAKATPNDDSLKFVCQHGKSECAGNKAHSCGLYLTPNQETAVKYVACAMESRNYDKCVEEAGLDSKKYQECYTSELGTLLQLKAALKTKELPTRSNGLIAFVPTIVYNNTFNNDKTSKSQRGFVNVLCKEIKETLGVLPPKCKSL